MLFQTQQFVSPSEEVSSAKRKPFVVTHPFSQRFLCNQQRQLGSPLPWIPHSTSGCTINVLYAGSGTAGAKYPTRFWKKSLATHSWHFVSNTGLQVCCVHPDKSCDQPADGMIIRANTHTSWDLVKLKTKPKNPTPFWKLTTTTEPSQWRQWKIATTLTSSVLEEKNPGKGSPKTALSHTVLVLWPLCFLSFPKGSCSRLPVLPKVLSNPDGWECREKAERCLELGGWAAVRLFPSSWRKPSFWGLTESKACVFPNLGRGLAERSHFSCWSSSHQLCRFASFPCKMARNMCTHGIWQQ